MELSAYTFAFNSSNSSSYRIRMYAAPKIKGSAAKNVTAASFHPKANDTATQPMTVKMDIRGKIPFVENNSCNCRMSLERRPPRLPDALASWSKKGIGWRNRLWK